MGMYGALIIYPSKESLKKSGIKQNKNDIWSYYDIPQPNIPKTATNRNFAYNDIDSYFDKEYVMLLSDIVNGENGISYLCSQMHSIYKLAPDTIANIPTEPINNPDNPDTVNYIEICAEDECNPDKKFFPQFYPMHNHDDYKVTNDGVYPGGQLTYIQTDAPINNKKDNK
ncbi:MAG: hypothetical protein ABF633_04425 [Clostridium sp.]|uniref:hypothetical protein n=1 Tax=Clostridium sp. TaxID=1506 RepID=UPI0039E9F8EC